jgi:serralysin
VTTDQGQNSDGLDPIETRFCAAIEDAAFHLPSSATRKARAAMLKSAFWGRGVRLRVAFMEGEVALHKRVAEFAQLWPDETGANFSFEFWIEDDNDPANADIRITFTPGIGSFSVLGRNAVSVHPAKRTMNLGWMTLDLPENDARAVVLHEFGHALGLVHEHMNPAQAIPWNRTRVIADLRRSQGWDDAKIEVNMFARYDPGQIFGTDVDTLSIMMYPIAPEWTTNGYSAPFNTFLTDLDKALILEAYGPRPQTGFGS